MITGEQMRKIKDQILRELGATLIHRHENGIGDIDVVMPEGTDKSEIKRKFDKILAHIRNTREIDIPGSILHVYTPTNAPDWLFAL